MWAGIQHSSQENTPCSLSPLERGVQDKVKQILVQYGLSREELSTPLNQDEVSEEIIDHMRKDIALKVIDIIGNSI